MGVIAELERRGIRVKNLCADSRAVGRGDVFVAMPGHRVDGRDYIDAAIANGAAAVLYEPGGKVGTPRALSRKGICFAAPSGRASGTVMLEVAELARFSGDIAHIVYGRPSERLWLAGVTGTNGKTSVSQWIAQAMNAWDCKCAVIGTLGNGFPPALAESANTTPDAISLHRALAGYLEQGAVACAMEVSSIGLDQGRVNGVNFDVAVFTNLTRDHLEYHGSMEAYGAAKAKLFETAGLGAAVINLDDSFGRELAARLRGRVRTIGYTLEDRSGADEVLAARNFAMTATGIAFDLDGAHCAAPLVGRFNAANLLAVIGALLAGDEKLADIAAVLPRLRPPPGRMQAVGGVHEPLVVVDYAHSPDALEKALATLRETAQARGGRLACVFGCGGDRDAGKRPQMGAIAERLADRAIVTSDNPRSEEPQAIIAAIIAGMKVLPEIEADRAAAIASVVREADPRDVILLAGKGHEPYQEIAGVRHPFSDLATAQSALAARHAGAGERP
ncbi:UDP-N-acetylmuramoylalanyl-D-glutamate--2,6-diaminopimelate ligase [Sulfurisoma sediminicola]|uniref:UDP-N-acetylmuramoyl-L-alanyl-D-glutamate--2,6-diaminopimelate ligase n=2 Tax=Sulfurisoma sediminicola TaxID=1381557 RepID=A0A497XK48_9PROT|nr:UDP-N-acetylmuramoylalanyl-D-glutamate--2,6-diaminopimelate ligase [Sulfurisoma sediminicola]